MKSRPDAGRIIVAANQNIKERQYWLTTLAGDIVKCRFPYDPSPYETGSEKNPKMLAENFLLPPDLYRSITKLSNGIDLKLHIILEAGLVALLKKYTGSCDIITGAPILKQEKNAEFINTILVFRSILTHSITFRELLLQVRETIVNATHHQNFPMEVLADLLFPGSKNEDSYSLFDVALLLRNIHDKSYLEGTNYHMLFSFQRTGSSIDGILEYESSLYRRQTIQQIIRHYIRLLEQALGQVDTPLSAIDVLSLDERHRLLVEFNDNPLAYSHDKTFTDLFQDHVEKTPSRSAIINEPETLNYIDLNEKANRLARLLRQKGTGPDTLVAVAAERSADMIIAVIAVMKSGGAYLPIDPDYPIGRIDFMLKDSGTRLLLTQSHLLEKIKFNGNVLTIDENLQETSGFIDSQNLEPINRSSDLVYVIYTSGSTGKPKGVLVQHNHFVNIALGWRKEYRLQEIEVCVLQMASFSFDVFAGDLARTFLNGGRIVINPVLRADTESLYRLISTYRVTLLESTPAYIIPLMKYVYDNNLEIDSLRLLILGSDSCAVRDYKELIMRFAKQMRIVNSYGVTEATIDSSYYEEYNLNAIPTNEYVPIGKPLPNVMFYILDEIGNPRPPGVPGELYIGGDSVTRGYLNRPELTAEKFIKYRSDRSYRTYISYKTGDMARWLHDGNMEFLGRSDYQVKIRGYRIELGEIENKLLEHNHIKDALVIGKNDINQDKYLCGYYIADKPLDAAALREFLGGKLPDYMVPWFFVQLDKFPITPNGKIDRMALPDPENTGESQYVAPRDEIERTLAGIWQQVLGIKDQAPPGIDYRFFDLGGNSLKAIIMISQMQKIFNVKLTLTDIFKIQTIRGVAEQIKNSAKINFGAIEKAEKKCYYPITSSQKRLYVLQQMDIESTVYNIPIPLLLNGKLEIKKLEQTFKKLIQRHESFRTSFIMVADEPVQRIHGEVKFGIEYKDAATEGTEGTEGTEDTEKNIYHFIRPFDLSKAPLFRVGLLKIEQEKFILIVDMHHIISDGTSTTILADDFMKLYTGEELQPLRIQYKDFAQWQSSNIYEEVLKKQEYWWLKEFSGEIPILQLPLNYPRPAVQSFEGSQIVFDVGPEELATLKRMAQELGITLYMVILSIYSILLAKLSSQEEVIIGAPVAGRTHTDLESIIGMFINTLTIRTFPGGQKTFKEFLKEIKERTLAAFENQDYPFEKLVEKVVVNRNLGRNPLFDAAFILQNFEIATIEIPELMLKSYSYESKISKFDLLLQVFETGVVQGEKKLTGVMEYSVKLFKPDAIERFISYFKKILAAAIESPGKRIAEIEIIPEAEKKRIIAEFNDTVVDYPKDKTIQQLFEEQVERTPDYIALIGSFFIQPVQPARHVRPVTLTYRQLNEQSHQLAGSLIEKGVLADDIVGIMMDQSIDLVIGLLGILKAGGAYMPIDPGYPQERIEYMLQDSGARIIIGRAEEIGREEERKSGRAEELPRFLASDSSSLAYIIYTSGSTGKPKGVMVMHRNVVRLVKNCDFVTLTKETRILQTGAPVFDAATFEIWGSLLNGGQLVLVHKELILNAHRLAEILKDHCINTLWLSAPLFNRLMEGNIRLFAPLCNLLVGGDKLSPDHINRVKKRFPHLKIINGYGPTENTTFSTTYLIEKEFEQDIPIGRPIANSTAYIFDKNLQLVPIGIWGELYVGGDGVSLGYLNNPELTRDLFEKRSLDPQKLLLNYHSPITTHQSLLYKTGDLARWLPDGNIEFLGRMDQQVKIRGFRIELREIEGLLLKHEAVKEAVVIDRKDNDDEEKYLCAYVVPRPGSIPDISDTLDITELRNYLSRHLPDYMVPTFFITIEKIPLNQNGKVDKKLLPEPLVQRIGHGAATYEPPRDYIESALIEAWSDVLNIKSINISMDDNFFDLGGHSLNAAALTARIHKTFNVMVPLKEFFQRGCIREIAKYIKQAGHEEFTPLQPAEKKEYYPLSPAQKRLYILQQINNESTAYNIPRVITLEKELDKNFLETIFKKLIQRHESLRTSFITINEKTVQKIHDDAAFEIEYIKSTAQVKIHHFDLSHAPLLRLSLAKDENGIQTLIVDMHHIISDGFSHFTLEKEFLALRDGKELSPVKFQYKDYVTWQNEKRQQLKLKKQEAYWLEEFAVTSVPPALDLPVDFPRDWERNFSGNTVFFGLTTLETQQLKKVARDTESTLFIVSLWIFLILLYRLSGQGEIVIGVPVSGRQHPDLEGIVGVFINTLPIRFKVLENQTALHLIETVKQKWLKAFENQDYPFEELVSKVSQNRDTGRNPLFDVMLNFIHRYETYENTGGMPESGLNNHDGNYGGHYIHQKGTSKFDLSVDVLTYRENLFFLFEYSTQLFKPETIEKFLECLKNILSSVLNNPGIKLDEIEINSGYRALNTNIFNDTLGDF